MCVCVEGRKERGEAGRGTEREDWIKEVTLSDAPLGSGPCWSALREGRTPDSSREAGIAKESRCSGPLIVHIFLPSHKLW